MKPAQWKDYSLHGKANAATISLTEEKFEDEVEAEWFSAKIDRKVFKQLIKREDAIAIRSFALWLVLLISAAIIGIATWGTGWAIPAFWCMAYYIPLLIIATMSSRTVHLSKIASSMNYSIIFALS